MWPVLLFIFWDFIGKAIQVYDFHIFLKIHFFQYYLTHFFCTTNAFCFKSYFVWCKYYNISFLPASICMVYLYSSLLHSFYVTLSVCPRILKKFNLMIPTYSSVNLFHLPLPEFLMYLKVFLPLYFVLSICHFLNCFPLFLPFILLHWFSFLYSLFSLSVGEEAIGSFIITFIIKKSKVIQYFYSPL